MVGRVQCRTCRRLSRPDANLFSRRQTGEDTVRHREIVVQLGEAAWLSHFSTSIDGIDIMSQFVTTVRTLTNKGALAALDAAEQAAIGIDRRLTIAGVDRASDLLVLRRMDGAVPVSIIRRFSRRGR